MIDIDSQPKILATTSRGSVFQIDVGDGKFEKVFQDPEERPF